MNSTYCQDIDFNLLDNTFKFTVIKIVLLNKLSHCGIIGLYDSDSIR